MEVNHMATASKQLAYAAKIVRGLPPGPGRDVINALVQAASAHHWELRDGEKRNRRMNDAYDLLLAMKD